MEYRKLGKNLRVSLLGMGGGVFNPHKDPNLRVEEAREVISYAVRHGVNLIDTGKEYDEEFLAKAMGRFSQRLHIITKSEARDENAMIHDIEDSLKKLGHVDVYQMHMVASLDDLQERVENGVLRALQQAKERGRIRLIGIFSHRVEVLKRAVKLGRFDMITGLYNAGHTLAENLFKFAKRRGVDVVAAAPFANGILVLPKIEGEEPNPAAKVMTAENALKFVLSNKHISSVLTGSRRLEHVKENIEIAQKGWTLSDRERKRIIELIESFLGKNFCRGCRYCEPCRVFGGNLPISDILKLKMVYEKYGFTHFARWLFSLKVKCQGIKPCTGCGECEAECPYGVPISHELKEAFRLLGGIGAV
jgi:predicted aldo/keto reductase-like oxidoreductase